MVPGVQDLWGRIAPGPRRVLMSPEQLRDQLAHIRQERALVVLLVDLLDASGGFPPRLRDLVGANPVLLVGTKVDLLPCGTNGSAAAEWLAATAAHKRLKPAGVHLVSARSGEGIAAATKALRVERRGRNVYVLGAANAGKSAFVRALMREMSSYASPQFDAGALATARRLPVESAMPGTTLQLIPLKAFSSGGILYDTPGLHLHHRALHMLAPDEARTLQPARRLRPYIMPLSPSLGEVKSGAPGTPALAQRGTEGSGSFWLGGLARIDVEAAPPGTSLTFLGPQALRVVPQPLAAVGRHRLEPGLPPDPKLLGAASVAARGGLRLAREAEVDVGGWSKTAVDVALSGVPGWVQVAVHGGGGRLRLRVWAPIGVEAYIRPPFPLPQPKSA